MERFWQRVQRGGEEECWEWTGGKTGNGYGHIMVDGETRKAHRLALELETGDEPGEVVMHTCDNRSCVNPAHLRSATQSENMQDCRDKGRGNYARGEDAPTAKLTEVDVREIRAAHEQGKSQRSLADKYEVSQACIKSVVHKETWAHVDE